MNASLSRLPNVVNQRQFTFLLNREIHKATRLQYPLSVLSLSPDLPRRKATPDFIRHLVMLAGSLIRSTDLATSYDASSVTLLLVDAETQNLGRILARLKGGMELIPGLTLSVGGGCYPQTATSGEEAVQQAVELMARARAEGGNCLYLPI